MVVILVRCNSYHWNMRLSVLELLMPGVARASAVPGLTNDLIGLFYGDKCLKNEMLSKDMHICDICYFSLVLHW